MRIATIVGTRPEIIKLSRTMAVLDEVADHVLIHTGQNYDYELNQIFFDELGIRAPDHYLDAAGATPAATIARVIERSDELLAEIQPDALLLLGDTNSALSVLSAKRRKIPIFHMEAGNRCFDERVPEEINRRIIDHISDINLPYTEHARRYLLAEGIAPDRVIKTGSPQREVLEHHRSAIEASTVLERLELQAERYFTASIHREENVDSSEQLAKLVASLNDVVATHDMPLVLSTHPRTQNRLSAAGLSFDDRVLSLPPLGFADYVALQKSSYCVISDSGTITEESSMVGFPAVTMREAHERPEGMDAGVLVMSGLESERLADSIRLVRAHFDASGPPALPEDYAPLDVSWKVAKIILSYTGFVDRTVWSKR